MTIFNKQHRAIRAPINPLDKSTIFSIYPREIHQFNPTIQPGNFTIPAGTYDKPAHLVVGTSSWWKEIDPDQPHIEIPVSSIQVAASIVEDYCKGLDGCNMADRMPGIFWMPGNINVDELKKSHKRLLDDVRIKQNNWYGELVKTADVMWARTNGNPISIGNDARLAAQELQLAKNKPWMQDFNTLELTNCPACGHLRQNTYPVCSNCKTVLDVEKFNKLGLKQAV